MTANRISDEFSELAGDSVDALIDLAGEIPFVGLSLKAAKTIRNISNQLYVRKVAVFLDEIATVSPSARASFLAALDKAGETERFGEAIILILDKLDEMQKPAVVGRIMAAHMRGEIDRQTAFRLATAVNRAFFDDLTYLGSFKPGIQGTKEADADSLFALGLLSNRGIDGGTLDGRNPGGTIYEISKYGELLAQFL